MQLLSGQEGIPSVDSERRARSASFHSGWSSIRIFTAENNKSFTWSVRSVTGITTCPSGAVVFVENFIRYRPFLDAEQAEHPVTELF